jgi:hypothetical protein
MTFFGCCMWAMFGMCFLFMVAVTLIQIDTWRIDRRLRSMSTPEEYLWCIEQARLKLGYPCESCGSPSQYHKRSCSWQASMDAALLELERKQRNQS